MKITNINDCIQIALSYTKSIAENNEKILIHGKITVCALSIIFATSTLVLGSIVGLSLKQFSPYLDQQFSKIEEGVSQYLYEQGIDSNFLSKEGEVNDSLLSNRTVKLLTAAVVLSSVFVLAPASVTLTMGLASGILLGRFVQKNYIFSADSAADLTIR
jgi:hypothetical protein